MADSKMDNPSLRGVLCRSPNTADTHAAKVALRRWQRDGFSLDPDNEDHVQAYMKLRLLAAHVSEKNDGVLG